MGRVDEYMSQRKWLKQNMKTTYIILWGQCSDAMRERAEATTDFKATSKNQDTIALLNVSSKSCSAVTQSSFHHMN